MRVLGQARTIGSKLVAGAPTRGTAVILDNFTGSATGTINARTPDTLNNGNTWTQAGAYFDVDGSGRLSHIDTAATTNRLTYINAAFADVDVETIVVSQEGPDACGLAVNVQDINNAWFTRTSLDLNNVILVRREAAVNTIVATYAMTIVYPIKIRVSTSGDRINVFANDSLIIDFTQSSRPFKTQTQHGFRGFGDGTPSGFFEYFYVYR